MLDVTQDAKLEILAWMAMFRDVICAAHLPALALPKQTTVAERRLMDSCGTRGVYPYFHFNHLQITS